MAAVHTKDTGPELALRRLVHRLGYRYRLHAAELPGRPDLVFRPRKKVIFVHGCFWHRHAKCRYATTPKSRTLFWQAKFAANIARDQRNLSDLKKAGWRVLTIWQCQLKKPSNVAKRTNEFLKNDH
jgi:DNA mismatch endonuclease (patch repair protein)